MKHEKKERKHRKAAPAFTGRMMCQKGDLSWDVVDFNQERKTVQCSCCGTITSTTEAIKLGRQA